jgi:hypothetical protein
VQIKIQNLDGSQSNQKIIQINDVSA